MKRLSAVSTGFFFLAAPFYAVSGCHQSPSEPPSHAKIELSVEDVSCTETWLRLSLTAPGLPPVILQRGDMVIDTIQLTAADTTVVDTSLLPGKQYTYIARFLGETAGAALSDPVQARAMDTTSNDWTFTTETLGGQHRASCPMWRSSTTHSLTRLGRST